MDDIYFSSSFPLNVQLSTVEPKSKGYVTFSTTATVLTQPALKCSLFHSTIHDSHSRSCFPASTYFSVHWLSQRLHMHVDITTSRGPMPFFFFSYNESQISITPLGPLVSLLLGSAVIKHFF